MINLTRILRSRRLNAQSFKVYRNSGEFREGGWVEIPSSPEYFPVTGIVLPSSDKELMQIPEGDKATAAMTFWSPVEIKTTRVGDYEGTSDKLEWRGELFKVVSVGPYVDYWGYAAICQRIKGA